MLDKFNPAKTKLAKKEKTKKPQKTKDKSVLARLATCVHSIYLAAAKNKIEIAIKLSPTATRASPAPSGV